MIKRIRDRLAESALILLLNPRIDVIQRLSKVLVAEVTEIRDGCDKLAGELVLHGEIQAMIIGLLEKLRIPDQVGSAPAQIRSDALSERSDERVSRWIRVGKCRLGHSIQ